MAPVGLNLRYAPHSEHGDDYFKDHRHHLSKKEQMRALELDPAHFFKVEQEPVHHEHKYFSDDDASSSYDSEDEFYEGLIDHHNKRSKSEEESLGFSSSETDADPNDIQFSINEDVQFKLESEDNYEGRDIDIGITMPDDLGGSGSGGCGAPPQAPSGGQTTQPYS